MLSKTQSQTNTSATGNGGLAVLYANEVSKTGECILMLHGIKVTGIKVIKVFSCGSSPDLINPAAALKVRPQTRAAAGQTLTPPSQTWPTPSPVIC